MGTITKLKTKTGEIRYRAQIRLKRGGRVAHSECQTFTKQAAAKAWMREREEALAKPGALVRAEHRGMPLRKLMSRYREEAEKVRPLGRSKHSALVALEGEEIAEADAIRLTAQQVIEHVKVRRSRGVSPATAKQDVIWLRVVMRYARRVWGVPVALEAVTEAADTLAQERLIAASRRRSRRPTADELRRLDAYFRTRRSSVPMDLVLWFAIYSCRRQAEITRLLRADFSEDGATYWVRDLKHPDGSAGNDKLARLPEPGRRVLEEILRRVPEDKGRLLPFEPKTIGDYFTRACHVLGIEGLRFHDLRREGCSRLAEDGATIPEIQEVSLHESWSSLQIYTRVVRQDRYDWSNA